MPKKQTPEEKARRKEARRRRDKAHRARVRQLRTEIEAVSKTFDHLKIKADGIAAEEKRLQEVHNQIQVEEEDELKVIRAKYAHRYEKNSAELKITVQARRTAYDDWRLSRDEAVRKVEDRFPDCGGDQKDLSRTIYDCNCEDCFRSRAGQLSGRRRTIESNAEEVAFLKSKLGL